MPTRNVNLTDELDRFVLKKVRSGRYENASEVVRAALRTLEREDDRSRTMRPTSHSATEQVLRVTGRVAVQKATLSRTSWMIRPRVVELRRFHPTRCPRNPIFLSLALASSRNASAAR